MIDRPAVEGCSLFGRGDSLVVAFTFWYNCTSFGPRHTRGSLGVRQRLQLLLVGNRSDLSQKVCVLVPDDLLNLVVRCSAVEMNISLRDVDGGVVCVTRRRCHSVGMLDDRCAVFWRW